MEQPQASDGPGKALRGTRHREDFELFAQAVIEADGEWVEMKVTGPAKGLQSNLLYRIGRHYAEVSTRKDTVYGRMKKSGAELDILSNPDNVEAIKRSLDDLKHGRIIPLERRESVP